jgi:hypothetical protein
MRSISVDGIPRVVEDTVYTAVGLGVLGFQRVQVQRQQLKRSLSSSCGDARGTVDGVARHAVNLAREAGSQVRHLVERRPESR